jgi:hypothetical protein
MNNRPISIDAVRHTLHGLLTCADRQVMMLDRASGEAVGVSRDLAVSSHGFLPVFLVAADAVWRDATGNSFGIQLARDPGALLGYRSNGVAGGPFSAVMLSMMEAIEQTARPGVLLMNDFDKLWRSIEAGIAPEPAPRMPVAPAPGVR